MLEGNHTGGGRERREREKKNDVNIRLMHEILKNSMSKKNQRKTKQLISITYLKQDRLYTKVIYLLIHCRISF